MSSFLMMDSIRALDSSTFTGDYQEIGSPLSYAAVFVKIHNAANQSVLISTDGSTDHEYLDSEEYLILQPNARMTSFASGTQFYAKGFSGEGNQGNVYVTICYNSLV